MTALIAIYSIDLEQNEGTSKNIIEIICKYLISALRKVYSYQHDKKGYLCNGN